MRASRAAGVVLAGLVLGALPVAGAQTQERPEYELIVDCPQARVRNPGSLSPCPITAPDEQDMMGSPSIAVDPRDPNQLLMASLHGDDGDGPSRRSREGQPFTTFSSTTHGASWNDRPFEPPSEVEDSFGEHPQIVTDPYGHVYVGSLYADPVNNQRGPGALYDYVIGAQKFENLGSVLRNQGGQSAGRYNVQFLDPFIKDNAITQFWYVFDPYMENMTVVWHERPQPGAGSNGAERPLAGPGARLGLAEKQLPEAPPPAQKVIGFVWTSMQMKSPYFYAPNEHLIGPCSASTNPVWSEGFVYVGCVVDVSAGEFQWNPAAVNGTVELFRFRLLGAPPQYLGPSPIVGGSPKLGVRSDGRIALFSAHPAEDGKAQLVGVFGKYQDGRIEWNELINYSPKIPRVRVDEQITEIRIQDLEYREYSGAIHLILNERVRYGSLVSVDNPLAPVAAPQFRKTLMAIDERHGWLADHNFDVGNRNNRTDPELAAADELNYDDLSDDILQLPPGNFSYEGKPLGDTYSREFVAVGDYGIVQFAEIIEITDLRPPGVPPAAAPLVPLAAPALALTPAAVLLPLAGTSFAGLLAFALLANRRKNPLAAYTKGEK